MVKQIRNPIKLLAYFLIPGMITAGVYALLVAPVESWGLPKTVTVGLAALVTLIPVELGVILYRSRKEHGSFAIGRMLPYQEKLRIYHYLWFVPLVILWFALVFKLGAPVDSYIKSTFFSWLPDWYVLTADYTQYAKPELLITFLSALLITGIVAPAIEEVYFRGFLLPRMEWMGMAAPFFNALLFSLYHFWSPWQFVTRTIALLPLTYFVYKTKNIKAAIIAHCLLNIVGDALGVLALLLK